MNLIALALLVAGLKIGWELLALVPGSATDRRILILRVVLRVTLELTILWGAIHLLR